MRRKPRSMSGASGAERALADALELGKSREILAQVLARRLAQLDLDLVRRGLAPVGRELARLRALHRVARAGADRLARARRRDHVSRHVRERALHLDRLGLGDALPELLDHHLVAAHESDRARRARPARIAKISGSPQSRPPTRTALNSE